MSLIDTHCHLKSFLENNTLQDVLLRARNAGVEKMITVGTSPEDWHCYQKLASSYNYIFFTVGLHPCYVDYDWRKHVASISEYWNDTIKPVSLGEIGLDYFRLPKDKAKKNEIIKNQHECFFAQLEIAKILDCPIVIHSRNAFDDCIRLIDLSGVDWQKVVFHCFSEGVDKLIQLKERGGRASFTGNITYDKNSHLCESVKVQGVDILMLETDSPYLSPEPNRKRMNEPSKIYDIFEFLVYLLDCESDELQNSIFRNSKEFYKLDISRRD